MLYEDKAAWPPVSTQGLWFTHNLFFLKPPGYHLSMRLKYLVKIVISNGINKIFVSFFEYFSDKNRFYFVTYTVRNQSSGSRVFQDRRRHP
jgi:hypothetical protein